MADALSQRYVLVTSLQSKLLGFELIKEQYASNDSLKLIVEQCLCHALLLSEAKRDATCLAQAIHTDAIA